MRMSARYMATLAMMDLRYTLVNLLFAPQSPRRPKHYIREYSCRISLWEITRMPIRFLLRHRRKNCKSSTTASMSKADVYRKGEFLGQLISVMCENNEVGRLNALGFIGFQQKVEELLSFKARNSDPLRYPNYYKVLYSWHISRGDYRSGKSSSSRDVCC